MNLFNSFIIMQRKLTGFHLILMYVNFGVEITSVVVFWTNRPKECCYKWEKSCAWARQHQTFGWGHFQHLSLVKCQVENKIKIKTWHISYVTITVVMIYFCCCDSVCLSSSCTPFFFLNRNVMLILKFGQFLTG